MIVTELTLADGDGVELCRAARTQPQVPLVLVTTKIVSEYLRPWLLDATPSS